MPLLSERKSSGGVGIPLWPKTPGYGGGGGPDSSFPISSNEIATWFLMTGVAMLFAGLASAFIVLRGVPSWESIHLPSMVWGNTLVLLVSSIAFEMARRAVKRDSPELRMWLAVTAALGVAFVVGQVLVWKQLSGAGIYLATTLHGSFFYVLSSLHAVHILGGLIGLGFVTMKAWSGQLSSASFEPLRLCATYWHFMGAVWLFLLLLLVLA